MGLFMGKFRANRKSGLRTAAAKAAKKKGE
jgi:hypothetical protein